MTLYRARTAMLRQRRDDGVTLIELLVTMMILAVVSTLVLNAVIQSSRVLTRNDDENTGLQDAKVIMDRLGRDIREASSVVCDGGLADPTDATSADPNCAAHLQLWIDYNSNYVRDHDEIITWRLQRAADGAHYDVYRIRGDGLAGNVPVAQVQATSLIVKTLFTYDAAVPADAHVVTMNLQYDAIVGRGSDLRNAVVSAKLRNKG
jgi:prepilin-type N-terminal cleavage/methylation domain-containing protein